MKAMKYCRKKYGSDKTIHTYIHNLITMYLFVSVAKFQNVNNAITSGILDVKKDVTVSQDGDGGFFTAFYLFV